MIELLDGKWDVFVTADKNLRYQQNLSGRKIAIVELPTNRLPLLKPLFAIIADAVNTCDPGAYVQLESR